MCVHLHDVGHFVPTKPKEAGVILVYITPNNNIQLIVHCPVHLHRAADKKYMQ